MSQAPAQAFQFALFFFAYYGYVGIFSPYASLYFAKQGMNPGQIAILISLMQVMRIFGPNAWGALADHSQRRVWVLRISAIGAMLSFIGMFWADNFVQFFILAILIHGFTSAQGPLSEAAMVSGMRGDLSWYGRVRLWGSVGFIVCVMAAAPALDYLGILGFPWLCSAMLGMVVLSAFFLREEAPPVVKQGKQESMWKQLKKPEVLTFFTSTCLMIMAHAALYVFYSLYLEKIGYGKTVIGAMWSLGVLAEIVFFFYQTPIFYRLGVRVLMLGSLALAVLRFLMIANVPSGAWGIVVLVLAQILHAATFGVHHSASVLQLQRWFGGPLQARGQALYTSISYGVGGTVGGVVMGWCWEHGGAHMVFVAAAILSAAAFAAAWLSLHWQARSDARGKGLHGAA